jgi:hypothetical protein
MAKTYAECEAQVTTNHPTFSVQNGDEVTVISPVIDPVIYDAMVAERAQWCVEQSARQEHEDSQKQQRTQVRIALDQIALARQKLAVQPADRQAVNQMPVWTGATTAQKPEILRVSVDEALQDLAGVIETLVGRGIVEEG